MDAGRGTMQNIYVPPQLFQMNTSNHPAAKFKKKKKIKIQKLIVYRFSLCPWSKQPPHCECIRTGTSADFQNGEIRESCKDTGGGHLLERDRKPMRRML